MRWSSLLLLVASLLVGGLEVTVAAPPPGAKLTVDGRQPVSRRRAEEARDLLEEGRRALKARRYDDAIAAFAESRDLDVNSWAGYELAAAYAARRDTDKALAILTAFHARGCVMCQRWLHLSTKARAFKRLRRDKRYQALLEGVTGRQPDYAALTVKLANDLRAGKTRAMFEGFDHGWSVYVSDKIHACAGKTGSCSRWYTNDQWLDAMLGATSMDRDPSCHPVVGEPDVARECEQLSKPLRASCEGACCTLDYGRRYDWGTCMGAGSEFDTSRIERVCWWPASYRDAFVTWIGFKRCRYFDTVGGYEARGYEPEP